MTMGSNYEYKHKQAAAFLRAKLSTAQLNPKIFLILGSGFRDVVASWDVALEIAMSEVPAYPSPNVLGHGTKLVGARVQCVQSKVDVLIATGRVHLYEGYSVHQVALPIFMAHELGIKSIILTNAAGSVSDHVKTGSVVAISDHLNLTGQNIAAALAPHSKSQFVEMVGAYDHAWREAVCKDAQINSGIYAGMLGPTFETPAEARMLKNMGADLAGMSTVQEVIAARICGQKVFACSFVTNQAGGIGVEHGDVLKSVAHNFENIKKTLESAISRS
jgi:purine-nucleoside phosphorylase